MFNHIFFVINPAAGQNEPVLEMIGRVFLDSGIQITIHVLEEGEKTATVIPNAAPDADLIAIYGGDGSVTEAAVALIGKGRPLAIIPGGTANVMAKELGIPLDTEAALELLRDGKSDLKAIDTGLVNGRPFLLRVNLGIMAGMITKTDAGLKEKIGQLAYGVAAIETIRETEPVTYQLLIDGEKTTATGVSLTVTNSGNMGIGDLQLQRDISVTDGLLDVLLLRDAAFFSLLKAAGTSLLGLETGAVQHWQCREITIHMPAEKQFLCDDAEEKAGYLLIKVVPASLLVVIPKPGP